MHRTKSPYATRCIIQQHYCRVAARERATSLWLFSPPSLPFPPTHLTNRVGRKCCPFFLFLYFLGVCGTGRREKSRDNSSIPHTHIFTNRAMTGCKSAFNRTESSKRGLQLTVVRDVVVERVCSSWCVVRGGWVCVWHDICNEVFFPTFQRREWRQGPYVQAFVGCSNVLNYLFCPSFLQHLTVTSCHREGQSGGLASTYVPAGCASCPTDFVPVIWPS